MLHTKYGGDIINSVAISLQLHRYIHPYLQCILV